MNSRVVLAIVAYLSLTILISGCSMGASEKDSPAVNPSKPAVSKPMKTSAAGTGFSDSEVGPFGLNLVWSYHHPNKIQQSFEANGNLYLVSAGKQGGYVLVKIDGKSGLPHWTYPLQVPLQFAPTVYVYPEDLKAANPDELFIVERGTVFCIDDRYGARNYKIPCNFPISTSVAAGQDILVLGGYDMRIYGLSKADRFVSWTFLTSGGISATPLNHAGRSYVGSEDGSLYALNQGVGFVRGDSWKYKTLNSIEASPSIDGDRIYVASRDTKIHCVSDVGDESYLNWQTSLGLPALGHPVIAGNSLYAVLRDDRYSDSPIQEMACLDTADGKEKWRQEGIADVL
ncbi:MAG: PQQ-binding-like beta-propeller repeat protein, partial [Planctomycetota bacterium]